jgi:hypothetical protein
MKTDADRIQASIDATTRRSQECCERKKRYADEWAARAQGSHQLEEDKFIGMLYVYKCKWCRGFHLTRQELRYEDAVNYYFKGASK